MHVSLLRYGTAAAVLAFTTACGGGSSTANQQPGSSATAGPAEIRLDGSSTVFPISEAVAEEFQKANQGTRVTVGISGTGGGFQKFCRGETDISDASRPISKTELTACAAAAINFIELPIAYDGIAIVVNPKATWINDITVDELKKIWAPDAQGKVLKWNQVRQGWPDREIHLYGAGVDSGTYDYFTEAVNGKAKASRGDFTSSEDDNMLVQGVSGDDSAFGFIPFAYYEENKTKLKLVPVDDKKPDNGNGPIAPSFDSIRTGTYQPLARPLFIYVSEKALARPEVQKFVDFYLTQGPKLAEEVGYVELGGQVYQLVRQHYTDKKMGSAFAEGAAQVGMTIEQLLSRERAQ
jgi:phosphate transport system substrate-binding protein